MNFHDYNTCKFQIRFEADFVINKNYVLTYLSRSKSPTTVAPKRSTDVRSGQIKANS